MSMPASACFSTTAATAARMRAWSAARSTGTPSSLANIMRTRPSGRGRLPVCVVRKRSVLRLMMAPHSMETRHDLFAQQLQRTCHLLSRNKCAEVQLRQDPVQPEFLVQLLQPVGNIFRAADDHLVAHHLFVGDGTDDLRFRRAAS